MNKEQPESIVDFKARISAMMRGKTAPTNGDYVAPQLDAATIMQDVEAGIERPAHDVRGPRP